MRRNSLILISASLLLTLASCGGEVIPIIPDVSGDLDSPSYDGGLAGDEANDIFDAENDKNIEVLLENALEITKYTYEVDVNVNGITETYTQYYTPNAWYTEGGTDSDFGYAQTNKEKYLFKYYLNEEATEVYPSIYEYSGYYNNEITTGLYSPLTIANIGLLKETLDTLRQEGYQYLGGNRYVILDSETMSVFQFMSSYGSSLSNYISSCYVQIIDLESCIFETTLDLGSFGEIKGRFTPQETTKIDFVNDAIINDGLQGVREFSEVSEVSNLLKENNFTLQGIRLIEPSGLTSSSETTIYCTNDYFLYDYKNDEKYTDFGFAFIKANTEVPIYYKNAETGELSSTPIMTKYAYDGCFEFERGNDGIIRFVEFIGPIENESTKYVYVEELPATGESGYLYICEDKLTGVVNVYEYVLINGKYQWNIYSEWYDTVGDFYVYNYGATFYLGSTAFTALAASLFEQQTPGTANHKYFSSNLDVISAITNGLFGWGFQDSSTWLEHVTNSYLEINYGTNNEISSFDLGVGVMASVGGGMNGEQKISYNFSNFGTTTVEAVDNMLSELYGE